MDFLNSLAAAFSMYSILPMPHIRWEEKNIRHALCFFPLVGAVISGVLFAWYDVCLWRQVPSPLFASVSAAIPIVLSGGIHMDGFCDTCDALFSRRGKEEKLRILKDSTCGSFAVIGAVLLLLLTYGAWQGIYVSGKKAGGWLLLFVLSRCLSGLSITVFPCAPASSLAALFSKAAARGTRAALMVSACFVTALMCFLSSWQAVPTLACLFLFWGWYVHMSRKEFGGITGDLAGFFLQGGETLALLAYALA